MFTKEELQNILALISRAQITGQEAPTVTNLQVKIQQKIAELLKNEDISDLKRKSPDSI